MEPAKQEEFWGPVLAAWRGFGRNPKMSSGPADARVWLERCRSALARPRVEANRRPRACGFQAASPFLVFSVVFFGFFLVVSWSGVQFSNFGRGSTGNRPGLFLGGEELLVARRSRHLQSSHRRRFGSSVGGQAQMPGACWAR